MALSIQYYSLKHDQSYRTTTGLKSSPWNEIWLSRKLWHHRRKGVRQLVVSSETQFHQDFLYWLHFTAMGVVWGTSAGGDVFSPTGIISEVNTD